MVSVITVNYNGLADTCEMIESFRRYETYPYEIIVVDNGSRNPEGEIIRQRYPHVKVVAGSNRGFAGGNNAALPLAAGDYLFFLNNDTLLHAPVLEALVHRLQEHPQIGGVSPMIKYQAQPDTLQYAGFTPLTRITLRCKSIGYAQQDAPCFRQARPTASLHGAAMMVPRHVLQQAGPMTEVYFLFYEEHDWSEQLRRSGYQLWYEPAAVVYHKEGMSAPLGTPFREFYLSRARLLFARRNRQGLTRMLSCLYTTCIACPKKVLVYLTQGNLSLAWAVMRGTWQGMMMPCRQSTKKAI